MNDERHTLTADDRAILATIDAALADEPTTPAADTPLADFARLLRDSAPAATDDFRQRLRADVLRAAAAEQAEMAAPWWRRRLTRRQAVAGGIVGLGLGGAAVAAANLAAILNDGATSPGNEAVQGWALDQSTSVPLALGPNSAGWTGPNNVLYEYNLVQIQRERWQRSTLPAPTPGNAIVLGNGHLFPIPTYLPDGFRWQGIAAIQDPSFGPRSIGSLSGGGGGSGLPWERFPTYDRQVAAYLIGGDLTDRFLFLAQLRLDGHPSVNVSSILFDSLAQPNSASAVASPPIRSAPLLTPTPISPAYAAKIAAMALVQPANGGAAVTIRTGASAIHYTIVRGWPARWFNGIWVANGQWLNTDAWTTIVWEQNGLLYQLAGQQIPLDELIRVAESLPTTP